MPAWNDLLAEHHGHPARHVEQLLIVTEDPTVLPKQFDLVCEAIGDGHFADIVPKLPRPPRRLEVQDNEIPDRLIQSDHVAVVFVAFDG